MKLVIQCAEGKKITSVVLLSKTLDIDKLTRGILDKIIDRYSSKMSVIKDKIGLRNCSLLKAAGD